MRIAINGFGRIGRTLLRVLLSDVRARDHIEVACINVGPAHIDDMAYLFRFDTIMGTFQESVEVKGDVLRIGSTLIPFIAVCKPHEACWGDYDIDWVVDCSGQFTKGNLAKQHLSAGARHVLISSPSTNADICIIPGVNGDAFDPHRHSIVSLGSCTTNAFLPLIAVLHRSLGIEWCMMTTVHAYTNSQVLLDVDGRGTDVRRFRSAAENIIPTTTGAAMLVGVLFPELEGRVSARALRVPISIVSLIDVTCHLKKAVTAQKLNELMKQQSEQQMRGIIEVSDKPLVSSDFKGNSASVIVDTLLTHTRGRSIKLFGWYDNEWGYSCRLRDFLLLSSKRGL